MEVENRPVVISDLAIESLEIFTPMASKHSPAPLQLFS